jgi:hypothetical protein
MNYLRWQPAARIRIVSRAFAGALSAAHPGRGLKLAGDPPAWRARTMVERAHHACVAATLLLIVAWMSACTYSGRDDAISQRFTWFSYMNGDDIRAQCGSGSPARYRFVYNAVYIKQTRAYDIAPDPGSGFVLTARVLGPSDLSNVVIQDPLGTLAHDPLDLLAPFAGIKRSIGLSSRDIDALDAALAESGFFQPAPSGLYLRSEDFFWVGVACIGGRLTFNAWKYPSSRFDNLTFPRLLFAWDPTGVAVNPPRQLSLFDIYGQATVDDRYPRFTLTVDDDGIVGTGTLF